MPTITTRCLVAVVWSVLASVAIHAAEHVMLVKGAVPGGKNGRVTVLPSLT